MVRTDGGPIDIGVLVRMTGRLRHRGPDDEGYLVGRFPTGEAVAAAGAETVRPLRMTLPAIEDGALAQGSSLGFGHRRLSIIDCTPGGHQPMVWRDGALCVVYNGEIYNHIELRAELERKGHVFRTRSDTEVLLAAYAEWGAECLQRFNGMWAFCLWDRRHGQLFCARDRFGVKPFYFRRDGALFAFASEIKALLALRATPPAVNAAVAYDYLQSNLVEHTPETMLVGIEQLPAGHHLIIDGDGAVRISRYYILACATDRAATDDAHVARLSGEYRDLLTDAVRLRLRTDVPLGSCLSGGLDSSSIVCALSEILRANGAEMPQRTFTAAYDDPSVDERRFAAVVAAAARVHADYVFPSAGELWDELTALTWHQDEPFGSTSIYAQWCVMRAARRGGVTVMLDGQGADELLAGYVVYYPIFLKELLRRGRLGAFRNEVRAAGIWSQRPPWRLIARSLAAFYEPLLRRLPQPARGSHLLAGDFAGAYRQRHPQWQTVRSTTDLQQRLWADTTQFNLPQLLRYEDRNSMAFAIETRLPFLDYRLVEWCFRQPPSVKLHHGWTKYVARRGIVGLCPDSIVWRRDKLGFVTPEARWMGGGEEIVRLLSDPTTFRARRFLDPVKLRAQVLPGGRLTARWRGELWRALNFELWMRVFGLS